MCDCRYCLVPSRLALWLAAMVFLAVPAALAQPVASAPAFDVDAVSVRPAEESEKTRLDLYTRLPYAHLDFLATDEGFRARYHAEAAVFRLDRDGRASGQRLETRTWQRVVTVPTFEQTQSQEASDRTTQSFLLEPGRYMVQVQVEDEASGETFVRELPVRVRDLDGAVALSDLILLDDYDPASSTISPSVRAEVGLDNPELQLFYELYAEAPRRVTLTREVIHLPDRNEPPSIRTFLGLGEREEEGERVVFTETRTLDLEAGRTQAVATLPLEDVRAGEHVVRVQVEDAATGEDLDVAMRGVSYRWTGLTAHIGDLDAAISQLQYIAKRREMREIREAETREQMAERFRAFWSKRDPTPGTDRNERMEEYYFRVAFANRAYGNLLDGWQTDRGHVHVLFGEPDYVERHPFSFDSEPYEVWYYYRLGRRYIFIDKTGFGNFELLVPLWDDRTRLR